MSLIKTLQDIVGKENVLTDPLLTKPYRTGFRYGQGEALAVVTPQDIIEQYQVFEACAKADVIIITQAANTGLTGGSTPFGSYDRDVVIINTIKINGIQLINDAKEAICLSGSRLNELERILAPYHREPHSVIGSTCIGASIVGGVCNNSGGSLIQRGPAYTEMALFARINEKNEVELINHLGVDLGESPIEILTNLKHQKYTPEQIQNTEKAGHAKDYIEKIRDVSSDTPSRYNADPTHLFESSGCAGKLMVFAVRLDTFPKEEKTQTFYIGTNDPLELETLRKHVLSQFKHLPIQGEYIHKNAYKLTTQYGKDTFLTLKYLGQEAFPKLFKLKSVIDRFFTRIKLGSNMSDKIIQALNALIPNHLPKRMNEYAKTYEHHLILRMGGEGIQEATDYLHQYFKDSQTGHYFICTEKEATAAFAHRFAVGMSSVRYQAVHHKKVEGILALDVALPRNEDLWQDVYPPEIEHCILERIQCAHFLCHVMHWDYVIKKGTDMKRLKQDILKILDQRGVKYPAEHNIGHLYQAAPEQVSFFKELDPTNTLNPGIGYTARCRCWSDDK